MTTKYLNPSLINKFIILLIAGLGLISEAKNYSCEEIRIPSERELDDILRFRKNLLQSIDHCWQLQPRGNAFENCYQTSVDRLVNGELNASEESPLFRQKVIEAVVEGRFHILNRQLFGYKIELYQNWLDLRMGILQNRGLYKLTEFRFKELEQAIQEKFKNKRQYLTRVMASNKQTKPDLSNEYESLLTEEALANLQIAWVREIVQQESSIFIENREHKLELLKGGLQGIAGSLGFLYIVYYGRNIFNPLKLAIGSVGAGCSLGAIGGTAIHLIEKTTHTLATAYKASTEHQTPLACEWSKALEGTGNISQINDVL